MAEAVRHRFTIEDYERMAAAGILTDDDRVELIAGEIVRKPLVNPEHAAHTDQLTEVLVTRLHAVARIRVQNPIRLPATSSQPEPDLADVRRRPDRYRTSHPDPADVLLVIEVADSSLRHDRLAKIPLYAAESIPEVWLVDVDARRIEVYRDPGTGGYASVTFAAPGSQIAPLAFPDGALAVDDLLP